METLNAIYEWMLSNGIRASLLVPLVLAMQWLLRKKLTAQWRYSLWLPVLVVLVLPGVSVLPTVESQPSSIALKPEFPLESAVSLEAPRLESAVQATQAATQDPATPLATVKTFDWQAFLAKAWMLTAAGALLLVFGSLFVTMRRFRRSRVPVRPELTQRVSELARAAGLRRAPQILMSEAVPSPAVAGFWKPVLLLNAGFGEGLSDEESDLVLSHELAHIRRGDLPLNALLCALLALHWFNPFLWLAFLRARTDREAACDAHVLRGESAARCATYGHTLLKMETSLAPRGLALGFVGLLPTGHSLRSRIQTIISQPKTNNTMKIVTALSITVLAFAGLAKADKPLQPKDIAPAEFKAHFARVDSPESMRSTEFEGIEGGKATIAVSKMNPLTKKFSKQQVTVKLADLDPALRAEIKAYWAKKQKMEKDPGTAREGKDPDKGRPARVFTNPDFLDLGQIDLNLNKKYGFNLDGLPNAGFLAGLAIEPHYVIDGLDGEPVWEAPAWFKDVQVKMTLTDVATNEPVFEIDQDLGKFTVGTVNPEPNARPVKAVTPGQSPRFFFFADGTLSTPKVGRFTPAKDQKFRLTLEIKSATHKARLASLMVTAQGDKK